MYPFNGTCTQRYAIPTSYYGLGLLPNCSENTDGHYEYQSRPCDAYYKCEGGVATAVKCPPDTSFNVDTGICMAGIRIYLSKHKLFWFFIVFNMVKRLRNDIKGKKSFIF